MTISTMSTNNNPNASLRFQFTLNPSDLTLEQLNKYADSGFMCKKENYREHFALAPCWMQDPASGVLDDINKNLIGKWSKSLKSYVVAVKDIRSVEASAGMNEDHQWLHVDIVATFFTFSPEEGQRLTGEIKKVGKRAAICVIFDAFTATVLPNSEEELATWKMDDILTFKVFVCIHRRKGPIIKAKCLSHSTPTSASVPAIAFLEEPEVNIDSDTRIDKSAGEEDVDSPPRKKKKKKDKFKEEPEEIEQLDQSHDDFICASNIESEEPSSKKKKKKKSM